MFPTAFPHRFHPKISTGKPATARLHREAFVAAAREAPAQLRHGFHEGAFVRAFGLAALVFIETTYTINGDINGNYSKFLVILISVSHNIVLVWCYDIILMW